MSTKICSKCKVEKDSSEFAPHARSLDGLRKHCKVCCDAASKAHHDARCLLGVGRKENRERERIRALCEDRERERIQARALLREENREKARVRQRERSRVWYKANREKAMARNKAWYKANPEKVRVKGEVRRARLTDDYIRNLLRLCGNVPRELIKAKREQLHLFRATRGLIKAINEISQKDV